MHSDTNIRNDMIQPEVNSLLRNELRYVKICFDSRVNRNRQSRLCADTSMTVCVRANRGPEAIKEVTYFI